MNETSRDTASDTILIGKPARMGVPAGSGGLPRTGVGPDEVATGQKVSFCGLLSTDPDGSHRLTQQSPDIEMLVDLGSYRPIAPRGIYLNVVGVLEAKEGDAAQRIIVASDVQKVM